MPRVLSLAKLNPSMIQLLEEQRQASTTLPLLVVLLGPTASGKTALSLDLARRFSGEIVSCDSVAIYHEMEIGTAKPSLAERNQAPHHLIDIVTPSEIFSAGNYSRLARKAIAQITCRNKLPIVTGGTGLYLRALLDGLSPAPQRTEELRERLRRAHHAKGADWLHRILRRLDSEAAGRIHSNDVPKLIRAIEVTLSAGKSITETWQAGREPLTDYRILRIGLNPDRQRLYERINARAAAMFDRGLVDETRGIQAKYGEAAVALASLGYRQAASVLRDEFTVAEAITSTQQGHRNYAKRQMTWFRREPDVRWIEGFGDEDKVQEFAEQLVTRMLTPATPAH
jgi:tRNA dimethylallyltransferase